MNAVPSTIVRLRAQAAACSWRRVWSSAFLSCTHSYVQLHALSLDYERRTSPPPPPPPVRVKEVARAGSNRYIGGIHMVRHAATFGDHLLRHLYSPPSTTTPSSAAGQVARDFAADATGAHRRLIHLHKDHEITIFVNASTIERQRRSCRRSRHSGLQRKCLLSTSPPSSPHRPKPMSRGTRPFGKR